MYYTFDSLQTTETRKMFSFWKKHSIRTVNKCLLIIKTPESMTYLFFSDSEKTQFLVLLKI